VNPFTNTEEKDRGTFKVQEATPEAVPMADGGVLPESYGPYRIATLLGEGGMAMVYRAEHTTLGRVVALKVLKVDFQGKPGFTQLFLREAKLAASVEHPNVVPIYDAGEVEGRLYMALRYIPGGDVLRKLQRMHRLSVIESLQIGIDCAKGLSAIHKAGLIHRDIKPSNIFLEEDGSALLADLGIARAVNADESLTKIYMPGFAMGTPAYMSPEQARGQSNLDIRSDIYALGATLFQILTGREVFQGNTEFETVAKVIYEPPPDPRTLNPDVPQLLVTTIHKALEKDPAKRYQTPLELLEDLRTIRENLGGPSRGSLQSDSGIIARPPSVPAPVPVAAVASAPVNGAAQPPSQTGMAVRCPLCQQVAFENEMLDFGGKKVCSTCVKSMLANAEQARKPATQAVPVQPAAKPATAAVPVARHTPAPVGMKTVIFRGRVVQVPDENAGNTPPPAVPTAPAPAQPVAQDRKTGGSFITRFFSVAPTGQKPPTKAVPIPVAPPSAQINPTPPPPVQPVAQPSPEAPRHQSHSTTIYRGRVVTGPVEETQQAAPPQEEQPPYEDGDIEPSVDPHPTNAADSGSRLKAWISKLAHDVGRSTGIISEKHDLELSGELGRYRLLQVIQFLNSSARTGELHVNGPNLEGLVAFDKGEIFFAYTGNRMGLQAVYQCVFAKEGSFRFEGSKTKPPRSKIISLPTMQILLECCRQLDEKVVTKEI
jgi:serine/threonine protein kinase